jgi:hypothetical protein
MTPASQPGHASGVAFFSPSFVSDRHPSSTVAAFGGGSDLPAAARSGTALVGRSTSRSNRSACAGAHTG